jgi:hypothetical protein
MGTVILITLLTHFNFALLHDFFEVCTGSVNWQDIVGGSENTINFVVVLAGYSKLLVHLRQVH